MKLASSRKMHPVERKLSEKRRKLMDFAAKCVNDVMMHNWEAIK
jgi:hypothetical protein